jgi:hypothetical protein
MQLLVKVQMPNALPSIMAGINQTIMLSLSMVVIASMIGAGGLGNTVLTGIQRLDVGTGFEGGLAVVVLAVLLDRMTQSFGGAEGCRLQPAPALRQPCGRSPPAHWPRPRREPQAGPPCSRPRLFSAFSPRAPPICAFKHEGRSHNADQQARFPRPFRRPHLCPRHRPFQAGARPVRQDIKIGFAAWADAEFVTKLAAKLIEDRLNTKVELVQTDVAPLYQGITRGDVDAMLMAWLPQTHADYWKRVEGKIEAWALSTPVPSWAGSCPAYVPESEAASIADLAKPAVRSKLGGRIQGIEPGAGLTRLSKERSRSTV